MHHANLVLTDTAQHAAFYQTQFGLPKEKVLVVPVGAAEIGAASDATEEVTAPETTFSVLFYGSMLPLHGIDIIVSAAAQISDLPIRLDFVGGNAQQARHLHDICATYGVTHCTHRPWVPLNELITIDIPRADLCLGGPFRRHSTGATHDDRQNLAMSRARQSHHYWCH